MSRCVNDWEGQGFSKYVGVHPSVQPAARFLHQRKQGTHKASSPPLPPPLKQDPCVSYRRRILMARFFANRKSKPKVPRVQGSCRQFFAVDCRSSSYLGSCLGSVEDCNMGRRHLLLKVSRPLGESSPLITGNLGKSRFLFQLLHGIVLAAAW